MVSAHETFAQHMRDFQAAVAKQKADLAQWEIEMHAIFDGAQWTEAQIEAMLKQERRK